LQWQRRPRRPLSKRVGDPDSFGRDVIYLGNAQTSHVALQTDCTPDPMFPPLPNDRCIVLNAQPAATSFNEDGSRPCNCRRSRPSR
jgi:hypothetical protein